MAQRNRAFSRGGLQVTRPDAAGVDVGGATHYAAVRADATEEAVRQFDCFTAELNAMADWFEECGVKIVAMESTGVYWIPLYEVLERRGFEVLLVNARHVKNVSGRKSDVLDCQWLQQLLTFGLLRGAFRPADRMCALRTFSRQRARLLRDQGRCVQHMQKAMTLMNIQLANVISDVAGATGERAMALLHKHAGTPAAGKRRSRARNAPKFDVREHLFKVCGVDLTRIDGIDVTTAMTVISEIGCDMSRFATVKHFTSWLGLCPGTKISGGKVLGAATKRSVNRATQALKLAAAALRSSKSALGAYYRRMCARMDKGKAVTAAAHKLARLIYLMLTKGEEYTDQGQLYYEERYRERVVRSLNKKAFELGMQLVPCPNPA